MIDLLSSSNSISMYLYVPLFVLIGVYIVIGIIISKKWINQYTISERYYNYTIFRNDQSTKVKNILNILEISISLIIHAIRGILWPLLLLFELILSQIIK